MHRLTPAAVVLALVLCPACTAYVGPPASPAYWRTPPPEPEDSDDGPQAIIEDPPPPQREVIFLKAEHDEPAARPRPRSINLGYTGDGVLTGGVTRDTVMEPRMPPGPYEPASWQDYVNAPKWRSGAPLSCRGWAYR